MRIIVSYSLLYVKDYFASLKMKEDECKILITSHKLGVKTELLSMSAKFGDIALS